MACLAMRRQQARFAIGMGELLTLPLRLVVMLLDPRRRLGAIEEGCLDDASWDAPQWMSARL